MQFIIDFKNDATDAEISTYLASFDCLVVRTFDSYQKIYLVESETQPPMVVIVDSIINDEENPIQLLSYVDSAPETYPKTSFATHADADWWKVISANESDLSLDTQTIFRRGADATVYIMDSGVMNSHPDFVNADISTIYSFNGDSADYNGHGTAIASIIAGEKCGIASPKVRAVKIFQKDVPTLQSHIIAALDAIIEHVSLNPKSLPIVNMSWSIPKNAYIESKIQLLMDMGIIVIVAAGNSGTAIENVTPASMADVCTVGAYDPDLEPCDFSNYTGGLSNTFEPNNTGALDVWAPGVLIQIAQLDGTYTFGVGTSMATAVHTAAMAYNSFIYVLSDGTVPSVISSDVYLVALGSSGRKGLLHLTEKYNDSINAITTFATSYDGDNNGKQLAAVMNYRFIAKSGERVEKMFVNELVTDSYKLGSPLPEGLNIDGGWLVGTVETSEPYVFQTTLTYTTHSGFEAEGSITIAIVPENMAPEDAGFDEELMIKLLGNGCRPEPIGGGRYSCDGTCAVLGGSCIDICGQGSSGKAGNLTCYCTGGYTQYCQ